MATMLRTVRVPLTTEEILRLGEDAAEVSKTVADMKGEMKLLSREKRSEIKEAQAHLDSLLTKILVGTKEETHEFDWKIDGERAKLIDLATGEVAEERDAYPHEKAAPAQLELPLYTSAGELEVDDPPVEALETPPEEVYLPSVNPVGEYPLETGETGETE